jgi:hypothetical protein
MDTCKKMGMGTRAEKKSGVASEINVATRTVGVKCKDCGKTRLSCDALIAPAMDHNTSSRRQIDFQCCTIHIFWISPTI